MRSRSKRFDVFPDPLLDDPVQVLRDPHLVQNVPLPQTFRQTLLEGPDQLPGDGRVTFGVPLRSVERGKLTGLRTGTMIVQQRDDGIEKGRWGAVGVVDERRLVWTARRDSASLFGA